MEAVCLVNFYCPPFPVVLYGIGLLCISYIGGDNNQFSFVVYGREIYLISFEEVRFSQMNRLFSY